MHTLSRNAPQVMLPPPRSGSSAAFEGPTTGVPVTNCSFEVIGPLLLICTQLLDDLNLGRCVFGMFWNVSRERERSRAAQTHSLLLSSASVCARRRPVQDRGSSTTCRIPTAAASSNDNRDHRTNASVAENFADVVDDLNLRKIAARRLGAALL